MEDQKHGQEREWARHTCPERKKIGASGEKKHAIRHHKAARGDEERVRDSVCGVQPVFS